MQLRRGERLSMGRAADRHLISCRLVQIEEQAVDSLAAGSTQSWFVVKVAVALSPILTLWAAGVIGWFLRRTLWRRLGVAPQPGGPRATNLRRLGERHTAPLPRSTLGDPSPGFPGAIWPTGCDAEITPWAECPSGHNG